LHPNFSVKDKTSFQISQHLLANFIVCG